MFVNDVHGTKLPVWTLDFETFYEDNRKGYSLRNPNINTIMYIRDPRFKAHGISVIEPDDKEYWITHADIPYFFKELKKQQIAMLVQNGFFDPLIASEHYDFFPAYILDTMCMSLGEWGPNERHNLEAITQRLELEGKLKGVLELTSGIRDLPPEIEEQLIPYALQDSRATKQVFRKLYLDRGYPEKELHIIDITLKAATRPLLRLDAGLCKAEIEEEDRRIQLLLQSNVIGSEALSPTCAKKLASEGIEGLMRSRPCFAELLTARGIVPPMKHAKTAQGEYKYDEDGNPVYTWAFAKNDLELQALADDERVSDLVSLWTGLKSTIRKTRAETFLKTTDDGTKSLPVPLKYYGARTGRWSGLEGLNMQNLNSGRDGRGSRLRQSILAPEGYKIIVADSSQVECVRHDTLVLTKKRGYVTITNLLLDDLLWDGVEWVTHEGVIFKGYREVIEYEGIAGTPDHIVYLEGGGTLSLAQAKMENAKLLIGERSGRPVRTLENCQPTNSFNSQKQYDFCRMSEMQDNKISAFRRFKTRQIKKLLRKITRQRILQNYIRENQKTIVYKVQQNNKLYKFRKQKFGIQKLSGTWNPKQIQKLRRICSLLYGKFSKRRLYGMGDRQDKQRWPLRTWESSTFNAGTKCSKTLLQYNSYMEWGANEYKCISSYCKFKTTSNNNVNAIQKRYDSRRNSNEKCNKTEAVYDILNAGPRNRFTANGVIVSNCRVNAWLWGQTDVLNIFKTGQDPYAVLASELYGVPVEKKSKHSEGINAHLRPVGKAMRLGLGYGMGWKKFLDGCLSGSIIGEVIQMTAPEAQRAVETYRSTDIKIVEGWQQCSNAIRLMSAKMAGYWLNDFLYVANDRIILPNELCIHYKNLTPRYDSKTGYVETVYQTGVDKEFNPIWTRIYGPKMVENIVQALARIIVAEQAIEISKRYPIVLLVHDEVVYLAPEEEADEALQFGLECMRTPLSWCQDIPLDAEGGHDYCYSK